MLVDTLGALVYLIASNKVFDINDQIRPPNTPNQSRCSFLDTKVSCAAGIVQLLQHELAYVTRPWNHEADVLAVLVYNTKATGHELYESKN